MTRGPNFTAATHRVSRDFNLQALLLRRECYRQEASLVDACMVKDSWSRINGTLLAGILQFI